MWQELQVQERERQQEEPELPVVRGRPVQPERRAAPEQQPEVQAQPEQMRRHRGEPRKLEKMQTDREKPSIRMRLRRA